MDSPKKKSAPLSTTPALSQLQRNQTALYLDHNLGGKVMAEILTQAGLKVEVHVNHFPSDCADEVWIPDCARRGWLIVTADKRIERDPVIAAAAIAAHARVLMLDDNNCRAAWWAAAIIVSRDTIFDQLLREKEACILPLRQQANLTRQLRPFAQAKTVPGSA